ncbi:MAG: MATE family efflux transporter [Deltaproteobacteria bacterium]|nr:MAG: MATE family efflux transporter [Deltaproteobacteria bacterium]
MVRTEIHNGPREVLRLAWPVIIQMLSYQLMTTADTIFVSRLGTAELAAVGLTLPIVFLFRSFGHGLLGGVRVLTSQRHGAGDEVGARRAGWQGVWIGVVMALPGLLAAGLGEDLLLAMAAPAELAEMGAGYFRWLMLGAPVTFGVWAATFWFQGKGDTRTPMIASLLGNALNIALDPAFIWGLGPFPAMGVDGAAVATVLSQVLMLAVLAWRFAMASPGIEPWLPLREDLAEIWTLGSPLAFMEALDLGAFAAFTTILTTAGELHLATHVVVLRIASLSFLPGHALASATGVLVGQAIGRQDRRGAADAIRSGLMLAVGTMVSIGVLFVAAPGPLTAVFGVDAEVAALAARVLVVAAAFQVFDGIVMVLYNALTGAGDTRFVLAAGVGGAWLAKVPVAWFLALPMGHGVVGAWGGFTVELVLLSFVLGTRVRRGAWLDTALAAQREKALATS